MKKLRITVNNKQYLVDVEVLEDDEFEPYTQPIYQPPKKQDAPFQPIQQTPAKAGSANQHGDSKSLMSPINGVIVEIPVKAGDSVKQNDVVIVLEAMKMKTNISSPYVGVIKSIEVNISDAVEAGQLLLRYE
jgi:glutaconyl-CoA/methylmalonyl-CoA decarboxylase subunit gamma